MRAFSYFEYGVELLDGEVASASGPEVCLRYGPVQRPVVCRNVIVYAEPGQWWRYVVGKWVTADPAQLAQQQPAAS